MKHRNSNSSHYYKYNIKPLSFLVVLLVIATPSVVSSFVTATSSSNGVIQNLPHPQNQQRRRTTIAPHHHKQQSLLKWRGGDRKKNDKKKNSNQQQLEYASLQQFAEPAAALFGNMITPASILCGAIIPLCFASGLDFDGPSDESKFRKLLRKIFPFASTASLASLLIAIMCSSVAVNQLTENKPALAASVWDLLQRDYALAWAAVNSHFVLGMLGFMWLIGTKAFFMGAGPAAFGLALSGVTAMISIVNRGVASGGGAAGQRFGTSILGLFQSYAALLWNQSRRSFGPLEYVSVGLFLWAVFGYGKFLWQQLQD